MMKLLLVAAGISVGFLDASILRGSRATLKLGQSLMRPSLRTMAGVPSYVINDANELLKKPDHLISSDGAPFVYIPTREPHLVVKYGRGYIIRREVNARTQLEAIAGLTDRMMYHSQVDGPVEYIITEREGENLSHYDRMDIVDAVKVGIQLVKLLEKLHTTSNIIHGAVGLENIVVSRNTGRVILVDWDEMRLVDSSKDFKSMTKGMDALDYALLPPSFADDVYQVMDIIDKLMCGGGEYEEYLQYLNGLSMRDTTVFEQLGGLLFHTISVKEHIRFFNRGFTYPVIEKTVRDTPLEGKIALVVTELQSVLNHVRATPKTDKPDYGLIIRGLYSVVDLAGAPLDDHAHFVRKH